MGSYGREVLESMGRSIQVIANGEGEFKPGGITIDWATVVASAAEDTPGLGYATYEDGDRVYVGEKFLRYGQVLTKITATGKFGPFDGAAVDGRAVLARGNSVVLNQSVHENDRNSDHGFGGALEGGSAFKARILMGGGGQPTVAAVEAAFPRMRWVVD